MKLQTFIDLMQVALTKYSDSHTNNSYLSEYENNMMYEDWADNYIQFLEVYLDNYFDHEKETNP
jgi:hypothetical protein